MVCGSGPRQTPPLGVTMTTDRTCVCDVGLMVISLNSEARVARSSNIALNGSSSVFGSPNLVEPRHSFNLHGSPLLEPCLSSSVLSLFPRLFFCTDFPENPVPRHPLTRLFNPSIFRFIFRKEALK